MLDINFIRQNQEKVKKGIKKKNVDPHVVDNVLMLDGKRRELMQKIDQLRHERNKIADSNIQENRRRGKEAKEELKTLEHELYKVDEEYKMALLEIPNIPDEKIPEGGEDQNRIVRKVGEPKQFSFSTKDHLALGERLGIIDVERAGKVSGSRFGYLKGDGALLEIALLNFAFAKLVKERFVPIIPPVLIKKEITQGLGYWEGGANNNYYLVLDFDESDPKNIKETPLYLVGTGEHSVVPMHKDEVLDERDLPLQYVAFSSCFRREAGSYGKDVLGILRVHQFDKIEMVAYTKPEDSEAQFQKVLGTAEKLMQELGLPYRIVELASGDISFPAVKTYDIETWMPGQGRYRETHSISTTGDFQSRRLNIKYRGKNKNDYVHILNGTALAIGRTIIAILENYQQEDGSILVPEILRPYLGKDKITPR